MSSVAAVANAGKLTFEEFQAINERARPKKDKEVSDVPEGNVTPAAGNSLGDFLEMPQVQSFMVIMIVVDVFASFLLLLLRLHHSIITASLISTKSGDEAAMEDSPTPFSIVELVSKYVISSTVLESALQSFTSFSLLFFALEMLAILIVFNFAVLGHLGYGIDCVVISFQLYTETFGSGAQSRILSIFRFWRLIRLINALVGVEQASHDATRSLMSEREGVTRQLQGEVRRVDEELEKEKEARKAVDEMLANYKEEVETLNEALKIAAMDIAEVAEADDDLLTDDEEDLASQSKGEADDNDFVDASGSAYDKARNRETLMREARRDAYNPQAAALRRAREGTATFHVHEDGTYDVAN